MMNGLQRIESSQESCVPRQQGIENKWSLMIFDEWQIARLLKLPFFQEACLEHGLEIMIHIRLWSTIKEMEILWVLIVGVANLSLKLTKKARERDIHRRLFME